MVKTKTKKRYLETQRISENFNLENIWEEEKIYSTINN
jgi:hypothetical protein